MLGAERQRDAPGSLRHELEHLRPRARRGSPAPGRERLARRVEGHRPLRSGVRVRAVRGTNSIVGKRAQRRRVEQLVERRDRPGPCREAHVRVIDQQQVVAVGADHAIAERLERASRKLERLLPGLGPGRLAGTQRPQRTWMVPGQDAERHRPVALGSVSTM